MLLGLLLAYIVLIVAGSQPFGTSADPTHTSLRDPGFALRQDGSVITTQVCTMSRYRLE